MTYGNACYDIFTNGAGNDTIVGVDGRDVVVYDKNTWGNDIIKATDGSMTILFNGLKSSQVKTELVGDTMTITRKNGKTPDESQTIVIEGWCSDTHNIVYGSGLKNFDKYMKATTTSEQAKLEDSARNEVWKKAGVLAS